jgi:hypothetical protein
MTGQDGGFRAAAARFSAEVQAALTRARRAAHEARAQSGEFRAGNRELAEQVKTGRLRGVRRDQVGQTTAAAREAAEKFRQANGLPVEELPDADALLARLPAAERDHAPKQEDDDFSQHEVMVDVDEHDGRYGDQPRDQYRAGHPEHRSDHRDAHREDDRGYDSGYDSGNGRVDDRAGDVPAEARRARIDSPVSDRTRSDVDEEDFSQQRILLDVTDETYRPNTFPDSVLGLGDEQNRS